MTTVDKVLHARWVIPVNANRDVLENHAVVVHEGKVLAVLPSDEARAQYQPAQEYNLNQSALIPGLINMHGHAAMSLFRGMADDLPLMTWLNDHVFPAEGKWVSEAFVEDGTRLAIAEMIRCGTTTFSDNYFFPEVAAKVVKESGVRAQLAVPIIDFPTPWGSGPDEHIEKGMKLWQEYQGDDQVLICFGPHAPYTLSNAPIEKIVQLANDNKILIQMHVHETQVEVDGEIEKHGNRPIARLKELGMMGPHVQCVHMTALDEDDINTIAESGAHVMHCPESNLKLASGFCPVHELQERGVNVTLGTDGAASNNDLDMLGEMRTAAQLAKAVAQNAEALPAYEALALSTINGAKSMGREDELGSIEVGKQADIAAIDLGGLEAQPVFDPVSQIVYATTRNQVSDVWVAGKQLLANRELTTISATDVAAAASEWRNKIVADRG